MAGLFFIYLFLEKEKFEVGSERDGFCRRGKGR